MDSDRRWYVLAATTVLAATLVVGFASGLVTLPGDGGGIEADARVTVVDEDGTVLATVSATVADTRQERITGLSETESLADGEGMLFVFPEEGTQHFVMRGMDFPLDMIFVGANRTITVVHHAPTRENAPPDAEPYSGRAKWVLEVPRGFANETGISVGDRVTIEYARTETGTGGGNRTG